MTENITPRYNLVCLEVEHSGDEESTLDALWSAGAKNIRVESRPYEQDHGHECIVVTFTLPENVKYEEFINRYHELGGC